MENEITPVGAPKPLYTIRTSDRRLFRRCFRKWGYISPLKQNLRHRGAEQNINFWFGTAIHFALEDYHSQNRFGDPRRALRAYYHAFNPNDRPAGASEYYGVGLGMLGYYVSWYARHNSDYQLETVWIDQEGNAVAPNTPGARVAVEQQFFVDIGVKAIVNQRTDKIISIFDEVSATRLNWRTANEVYYTDDDGVMIPVTIEPIKYHGTIDRIARDQYGRYWLIDYKTTKGRADTSKLDTDDQVTAYLWAAQYVFKFPIYGFMYLQLTKAAPAMPKRNKDLTLSVDKKQKVTYAIFRQALLDDYIKIANAPNKYIEFLNLLAEKETPEGDRFVRWDFIQRSQTQLDNAFQHILAETKLMLDASLHLYPNPTRDCSWDCPIRDFCIAEDDNRFEEIRMAIERDFEASPRKVAGNADPWRKDIVYPDGPMTLADESEFEEELREIEINLGQDMDSLDLENVVDESPFAAFYTED